MNRYSLTIGRLADSAGVNKETIRYYENRGLIERPPKPTEGFRIYPEECLRRVRFIKRAQGMGFSLREIEDLLRLNDGHCDDVRALAEQKRDAITLKISELIGIQRVLDDLIARCDVDDAPDHCAIMDALMTNDAAGV